MTIAAGTKLGPYEIAAPLGAGGMGEVYRARDTRLNRDVAIKVLPQGFAEDSYRMARFEREAQLLASLNHPKIAAIYGLEESGPTRALVMELVEGPTLAERIGRAASSGRASDRPAAASASPAQAAAGSGGKTGERTSASAGGARKAAIPIDEALPIAQQMAEALEYAHERGIVHRDLKPANIKVTPDGDVKVLDFGLAKAMGPDDASADISDSPTLSLAMTQAGFIIGTAAYMAPEQAKGKQVDRRADIWAFGCVLYEMLSGKKAFDGETISDVLAAVIMKDPDWTALPETTPPAMQRLVRRCLAKEPKQRLRDIGEARIAIEETLSGAGPDAETGLYGQIAEGARRPLLRRAMPWALAATTILFAATTAWLLLQPKPQQSVMRFSVSPPENTQFAASNTFSISPDGRQLVFAAARSNGGPDLLWVRSLDSLTARALEGTEGANSPFWSPDSSTIGFYANGKLEKVPVSGGAVQTLCDASGGGATWNRDGVILFADGRSLYRVPDAGGSPTLVAAPDAGFSFYGLPQFLPDGRHFLFLAEASLMGIGSATAAFTVKVGSLDSKNTVSLLKGSSEASYARPGYLFFVQGDNLMARGFDARSLKFTGQAVPVAANVSFASRGWAPFSVSQSGVLAYQAGLSGTQDEMAWFNRKGQKLGTVGQPGTYASPAISPDGGRLAVVSRNQSDKTDIWIYDLKRGTGSRLTFAAAVNTNPLWSQDGSQIYFSSNRNGKYGIYEKAANGLGNSQLLFQLTQGALGLEGVSPDGRYAIYIMGNPNPRVWAVPLSGDRKPLPYIQGRPIVSRGRFSPNGRYVAYGSTETGRNEVYVQTFPQHQGKWQISTAGGGEPMWRSDGKELFYLGPDNELMSVDVTTSSGQFQAGAPKPLFKQALVSLVVRNHYAVSQDGQRFLMLLPTAQAKPSPITVVSNWPALLKSSGSK